MSNVKQGDLVTIHYTGRFEDGEVFDSSEGREPLEFRAGGEEVIPGVAQAVVGMAEGEERTVTVSPEDAYGPRHPELQQEVERSLLPENVKVGDVLQAKQGEQTVHVTVADLDDDTATIDGNHPLAGKTLVFDLKLVDLQAEG